MSTVLLVDDHSLVRQGCRQALEAAGYHVVAEARDGETGLAAFEAHRPQLTIMDLSMNESSGLDAIRRILESSGGARVLVLSMHDEAAIARRAVQAGALGYVTKSASAQEFIAAVQHVSRGERYISDDAATAMAMAQAVGEADPLSALTGREFEIFQLLVAGHKTADISETLGLSPKSVTNTFLRIKHKLDAATLADLVRIAINSGTDKRNILPPAGRAER